MISPKPPPGTLHVVPRAVHHVYDISPLTGWATFPLPDGVDADDLIEIVLGPNGQATWSFVPALLDRRNSAWWWFQKEPRDRLATEPETGAVVRWIGEGGNPDLIRTATIAIAKSCEASAAGEAK